MLENIEQVKAFFDEHKGRILHLSAIYPDHSLRFQIDGYLLSCGELSIYSRGSDIYKVGLELIDEIVVDDYILTFRYIDGSTERLYVQ